MWKRNLVGTGKKGGAEKRGGRKKKTSGRSRSTKGTGDHPVSFQIVLTEETGQECRFRRREACSFEGKEVGSNSFDEIPRGSNWRGCNRSKTLGREGQKVPA